MLDLEAWAYISKADLSNIQMRKVIRSLMFLKEKRDAAGLFLKMKDSTNACMTVSIESLFVIMTIAAGL